MSWSDSGFTVLFLTPGYVARGDFDAAGKALAMPRGITTPVTTPDAVSLLSAALALSHRKPRRVWILSTLASLLMIELPVGKLRGLEGEERLSALAFEAEAHTGVPAGGSIVGAQLIRTDTEWEHWFCVQMPQRARQEMEAEIGRKGGRILGLLHPGGCPAALSNIPEDKKDWARMEFWPETLVTVHSESSGRAMEIAHWDVQRPVEGGLLGMPRLDSVHRSCLLPPGVSPPRGATVEALSLAVPETMATFLQAWAHTLSLPEPRAAIIRPPRAAMTSERRTAISVATAAAFALLCAGHWALTEWQLQRHLAELKTLADRNKRRDELQTTAGQVAKLRSDLEAARRQHRQELEGFSELLAALSETRPEGLVVRSIREANGKKGETLLAGLCHRPELAGEFANALTNRLQNFGWEIRPAKQKAMMSGGVPLWEFEIGLRSGATAASAKPSTASR